MKDEFIDFYINHLKKIVIFFALFSLFFVWAGYEFSIQYPKEATESLMLLQDKFGESVTIGPATLFLTIFINNILQSYAIMILGLLLGIVPFLAIYYNGFLLGLISENIISTHGVSTFLITTGPHGIFEIAAFIISCSMGWWLGIQLINNFRSGKNIYIKIRQVSRLYWKYIMPIFFLAALIETTLIFVMTTKN